MTHTRLQRAYDTARRWLREELPQAEANVAESLVNVMDSVREHLIAAEQLTRDEAQRVVDSLRFDLRESAHSWADVRGEMVDWARFDVEQIEQSILEKMLIAADPTWVELARLQNGRRQLADEEGELP